MALENLSICIPTYNRCNELKRLLDWIELYAPKEVTVVVRDNASSDNTWEVIQEWKIKTKHRAIINRNPENYGIDYNIIAVIQDSPTEYCWWMGDDDLFEPDVIRKVQKFLKNDYFDLIILNYKVWDSNFLTNSGPIFSDSNILYDNQKVISIVAELFSFISILIVKKKSFLSYHRDRPDFLNKTALDFTYAVLKLAFLNRVVFVGDAYIMYRGGADDHCFSWRDLSKPYFLGMEFVIGKNRLYSKILKICINRSLINIIRNKVIQENIPYHEKLKILLNLISTFSTVLAFWLKIVPRLILPNSFLLLVKRFLRYNICIQFAFLLTIVPKNLKIA
ncbi:MAG: glycosyltransferase family 2 protein [Chthoniobacterales bacterium]|nr:glycosyltransferase family 2 protein [Chthoniobacterales bacterium]